MELGIRSKRHKCSPCKGGQILVGALFWIIAGAVLVLPFLRDPWKTDWDTPDRGRNLDTDLPFADDVANFDADFSAQLGSTLNDLIRSTGEAYFGMASEQLAQSGLVALERLAPGQRVYVAECAGCHGLTGDGSGPASGVLNPRPRNFRKGVFKFRSTRTGERPVRSDIFRTITNGLAGSAMPNFRLIPEELRWDLVEYVRYLSMRGEFEQMMLDLAWSEEELPDAAEVAGIIRSRWDERNLRSVYPSVAEPERDQASIERGRALFLDPQRGSCFSCHGATGRGDGPTANDYKDDWGYPIRPRDFSQGVFRAGSAPQDLYLSIATGIGGTPMGSFEGVLKPEEIWDLVHYVQALATGAGEAK